MRSQLIVLDEEPRNKIQTVLHNYIQANLPDFKHAFQSKIIFKFTCKKSMFLRYYAFFRKITPRVKYSLEI